MGMPGATDRRRTFAAIPNAKSLTRRGTYLSAFRKRWVLFLLPIFLIIGTVISWTILLSSLERSKASAEANALKDANTLSKTYAEHLYRSLKTIDQIALYVKHAWQFSDGQFRLEGIGAGLFPARSGLYVGIFNKDGNLVTSTVSQAIRENAANESYFLFQKNNAENTLYIGRLQNSAFTNSNVLQFSRQLVDADGNFSGIVLVSVLPDYLLAGYDQISMGRKGLLAILDDKQNEQVTRVGENVIPPESAFLSKSLSLPSSSGTSLFLGEGFSDKRSRYVSWHATDGYGMTVLTGLDQENVLASHQEIRESVIGIALWVTAALATLTVIAMAFSIRLAWKQHQLNGIMEAYRLATEGGTEGFYSARPICNENRQIVDFEVVDCNQRGAELFGLTRSELLGRKISTLGDGLHRRLAMQALHEAWRTGFHDSEQPWVSDQSAAPHWVHIKVIRMENDLAVTLRDLTETKAQITAMKEQENRDALTNLPNRRWAEAYLPEATLRAAESNAFLAVLFINLDGFKVINEAIGHRAGDEVLVNAAKRIQLAVRSLDYVVRVGGDEFLVILEGVLSKTDVAHVAERIIVAFREPFRLTQGDRSISASIGISVYPEDATDAEMLLKNADMAMSLAKATGRQGWRFFDPAFSEAVRLRHEMERDLRKAIEQDQFIMHYQPRFDMSTETVSSMEALVRWLHPVKGMIEPIQFISLAEETGLILPLGEKVIDKVCSQLSCWIQQGVQAIPVSINVSARQFNEADMATIITQAIERHNIPPALVEIEVTESSMMGDGLQVSHTLSSLQKKGIKLLVDDFGTGYSSLAQLQELEFDIVKVDKAFTAKLEQTQEGKALFASIITMAHSLGMRVVAEGVENQKQAQTLKALHCNEIQGFFVSRPLPAEKVFHQALSSK